MHIMKYKKNKIVPYRYCLMEISAMMEKFFIFMVTISDIVAIEYLGD